MRMFLLMVAALLAAAGAATAQIAAPTLNPTPSINPVPFNPGVLAWSGPSRIGVGYGQATLEQTTATVSPAAEGDVALAQALLVGETFAIGAAAQTLQLDIDPVVSPGGGVFESKGQTVALGAQFGQRVGVGISQEKTQDRFPGIDETETLPTLGVALRLIGPLYVGAKGGTATRTDNLAVPADELERRVLQYGVAYYWREKERGLHLEVFHAQRDGKDTGTFAVDEEQSDGFAAEAVLANWLIGIAGADTDFTKPTGVPGDKQKQSNVSLGYVPAPGLAIALSRFKFESTSPGGVTLSIEVTSAGVAWQF